MTSQNNMLDTLGVCKSHFNYDNKQLHTIQKKETSIKKSLVNRKKCLFCGQDKYLFSRGGYCKAHSWQLCGRNVLIGCNGLKVCPIFHKNDFTKLATSAKRTRYICVSCFMAEGRHLYQRHGRGAIPAYDCTEYHYDDPTKSLQLIAKWINDMSESVEEDIKNLLLYEVSKAAISFFEKSNKKRINEKSKDYDQSEDYEQSESYEQLEDYEQLNKIVNSDNDELGEVEDNIIRKKTIISKPLSFLGTKILLRLKKVNLRKFSKSETFCNVVKRNPRSIGEALAILLWHSRSEVRANKTKLEAPSSLNEYQNSFPLILSEFFYGLINTMQEYKWKVVIRKQKERGIVEKNYDDMRAKKITTFFISVILTIMFPGLNIWFTHVLSSLCQKPRLQSSLYAILCTANVVAHTKRAKNSTLYTLNGSPSEFIKSKIQKFDEIFYSFVNDKWQTYDTFEIKSELRKNIPVGCKLPQPNIVILKPGDNPCNNINVHQAVNMYFNDIGLGSNNFLDISADQAIFRRLVLLREIRPEIRLLLGSWHT
ncbi:1505_t:CDS:2, partial [Cetraspora pellucida]